jgi:UDP-N-acetylglucosamine 2-epimerase (non-hydrolysing)
MTDMPRTRVAVFMGTRPEAIKLAPVIIALTASEDFEPIVISTGQHRELLDQAVQAFGLTVHHELSVMRADQQLAELTARLLSACDTLLATLSPDLALVHGDTTTALAASLACFYRRVPVGHVEAGLRTFDRNAPFPEELNRSLCARLCVLHFAPTEGARKNLLAEGIPGAHIAVTGNTVIDALHTELARQARPEVQAEIEANLAGVLGVRGPRPFVLVTGHRRENFGRGLEQLCAALATLAERFPDHDFIYPVHLNPNVSGPVHARLAAHPNVRLLPPLPYAPFVWLLARCRLVLTDSGGVQEEAPSLGKPLLLMRGATERPEAAAAGAVRLVEPEANELVAEVTQLLVDPEAHARMAHAVSPYGDGRAAGRIVERLRRYVKEGQ